MKFSDGEKLIIVMLAEIYKAMGIKGNIDPDLVQSAISAGNLWGLRMQYPGLFGAQVSLCSLDSMGTMNPNTSAWLSS
jgi:hypothetical protein